LRRALKKRLKRRKGTGLKNPGGRDSFVEGRKRLMISHSIKSPVEGFIKSFQGIPKITVRTSKKLPKKENIAEKVWP